jgi:predicted nucleic acid-binding protein
MKPDPNPAVQQWLNAQAAETLYLSSITLAELMFGISALPSGRRKAALSQTLEGLLNLFDDRVLPFDTDAARQYAELAVAARAAGKGFPTPDGYIGAIAKARGFSVATRDVAPFQAAGIKIIDPWEAS